MSRVSIGLPVFNGERYLEWAIRSLLDQSFEDFELIVSDNASSDRTGEISQDLSAQDPRVRYHRLPVNVGAAANFNHAFHLGASEYFKWAAHDDLHQPDYLSACVSSLDADSGIVLAHTQVELIDRDGTVIRPLDEGLDHVGQPSAALRFANLIDANHWCTSVFGVVRRDVLSRTHLIGSYVPSDRVLLAELGLRGRFHIVPRVLFQNREHEGRSIRASDIRSEERRLWFAPAKAGGPSIPFVRSWLGYAAALARVRPSAKEAVGATGALLKWLPGHRRELMWDARGSVGALLRRLNLLREHDRRPSARQTERPIRNQ